MVATWHLFFPLHEIEHIRELAKIRSRKGTARVDKKISPRSKLDVDFCGLLAEVTFKHFFVCRGEIQSLNVDPGFDFIMPDGKTVDVKGAGTNAWNCLNAKGPTKADYIVAGQTLMKRDCLLRGYLPKDIWNKTHRVVTRHGGFGVPYTEMLPIDEFGLLYPNNIGFTVEP